MQREAESFRKNWIAGITIKLRAYKSNSRAETGAWEGFEACHELNDTRNLWCVLPEPGMEQYPFPFLTEKLSREVYFYKSFASRIVPTNWAFKDAIDVLSAAVSKLKKAATQKSVVDGGLDSDLNRCCSTVARTLNRLKADRETYWQNALMATVAEKMNWDVQFREDSEVSSIPPAEMLKAEERFTKAQYPKQLLKRIDLDRRFQVRVATILRFYLRRNDKISLRTVSRLTVLTYIAGNLGREDDDRVLLNGRKRAITVGGVDQILRAAGMK
jgi:hypothetical protein